MRGKERRKEGGEERIQELKAIIPLYLNGDLNPKESQEIETLLSRNTELRKEVSDFSELKAVLRESRRTFPEPDPRGFDRILERVSGKSRRSAGSKTLRSCRFLHPLSRFALSSPRLAWAVVGILLVVSVGLGIRSYYQTRYLTLSSQQESAGRGVVVNVVFRDETRLKEVEAFLEEMDAAIIGGPYRKNLYVLVVEPGNVHRLLEKARQSPLVRFIEPAVPKSFIEETGAQSGSRSE